MGRARTNEAARVNHWRYDSRPQVYKPKADFIVVNPHFTGKERMCDALGDGYADALQAAWTGEPKISDFVMYWCPSV